MESIRIPAEQEHVGVYVSTMNLYESKEVWLAIHHQFGNSNCRLSKENAQKMIEALQQAIAEI